MYTRHTTKNKNTLLLAFLPDPFPLLISRFSLSCGVFLYFALGPLPSPPHLSSSPVFSNTACTHTLCLVCCCARFTCCRLMNSSSTTLNCANTCRRSSRLK